MSVKVNISLLNGIKEKHVQELKASEKQLRIVPAFSKRMVHHINQRFQMPRTMDILSNEDALNGIPVPVEAFSKILNLVNHVIYSRLIKHQTYLDPYKMRKKVWHIVNDKYHLGNLDTRFQILSNVRLQSLFPLRHQVFVNFKNGFLNRVIYNLTFRPYFASAYRGVFCVLNNNVARLYYFVDSIDEMCNNLHMDNPHQKDTRSAIRKPLNYLSTLDNTDYKHYYRPIVNILARNYRAKP